MGAAALDEPRCRIRRSAAILVLTSANTRPNTPEHEREQALEAATEVAGLANESTNAIASTDAARDTFAARILAAGTKLNADLVRWLVEEGVMAAHATEQGSRASNASDAAKFVALEAAELGLQAVAMSNPISAAALVVVDLGWDFVEAGMNNDGVAAQRRETVGRLESVGSWATSATTDVTRQLVQRYASLMTSYEIAKNELRRAVDADGVLRGLRERLSLGESASAEIERVREARLTYAQKLDHLHLVLRAIAGEAAQAEGRATRAFAMLMERYLRFRAGGGADSPAHARPIVTTGYLNADAPRPVGLTGTLVGNVDASTLGPSVASVATRRPLAEMAGWNVTIRLASSAGEVTLHQRENGERIQVIPDSAMPLVDRIGGISKLWDAVDRAKVGA